MNPTPTPVVLIRPETIEEGNKVIVTMINFALDEWGIAFAILGLLFFGILGYSIFQRRRNRL